MSKRSKISKRKGPYKHSVNSTYLHPNLIYLRLRLDEVFPDRDTCLDEPMLYETDRMPPIIARSGEYASWMNEPGMAMVAAGVERPF